MHGASRDRKTRGEQAVTAGIPPCHLRQLQSTMGLGRMEPVVLKLELQGHEVLKTDYR